MSISDYADKEPNQPPADWPDYDAKPEPPKHQHSYIVSEWLEVANTNGTKNMLAMKLACSTCLEEKQL